MKSSQTFTIPAMVTELGGEDEIFMTLKPPAPIPAFRVLCKKETVITLASHLYRWVDVTICDGKVVSINPQLENP